MLLLVVEWNHIRAQSTHKRIFLDVKWKGKKSVRKWDENAANENQFPLERELSRLSAESSSIVSRRWWKIFKSIAEIITGVEASRDDVNNASEGKHLKGTQKFIQKNYWKLIFSQHSRAHAQHLQRHQRPPLSSTRRWHWRETREISMIYFNSLSHVDSLLCIIWT